MIAQPRRHSLALKKSGFLHKEFYSQAFYLVQAGIPCRQNALWLENLLILWYNEHILNDTKKIDQHILHYLLEVR